MKKPFAVLSTMAIAASVVTPGIAASAATPAEQAPEGFYNIATNSYISVNEFDALSTDAKKELIKNKDVYYVTDGNVIKALDVLITKTDDLSSKITSQSDFEEANDIDLNKIASSSGEIKVQSVSAINGTTLSVTFEGQDEAVEVTLEEALTHGQTEVTFVYDEVTYEATLDTPYVDQAVVDAEALAAAIEAAETAIAELPETITLAEKQDVVDARTLVDAALALDAEAEIAGVDTLVAAEATIAHLEADEEAAAELAAAKTAAEEAIAVLPTVEELTLDDAQLVADARELVTVYVEDHGGVDTDIEGLDALEALEDQLEVLQGQADFDALVADTDAKVKELTNATVIGNLDSQEKIDEAAELVTPAEEAIAEVTALDAEFDTSSWTNAITQAQSNLEQAVAILEANAAVETAEGSLLDADYNDAKGLVDDLAPTAQRALLDDRLKALNETRTALLNEVKAAGVNQLKLAEVLQKAPFESYVAANIKFYAEDKAGSVSKAAAAQGATLTTIQAAIDSVNSTVNAEAAKVAAIAAVKGLFDASVENGHGSTHVDASALKTALPGEEVTAGQIAAAKDLVNAAVPTADWDLTPVQDGADVEVKVDTLVGLVKQAETLLNAETEAATVSAIKAAADTNNQVELKSLLTDAGLQVGPQGEEEDVAIKDANVELYTAAINASETDDAGHYNQLAAVSDIADLVNDINTATAAIDKNATIATQVTEVGVAQGTLTDLFALKDQAKPELSTELDSPALTVAIAGVETAITNYNNAVQAAEAESTEYATAVTSAEAYSEVAAVATALDQAATAKAELDAALAGTAGVKTTATITSKKNTLESKVTALEGAVTDAKTTAEGTTELATAKANYEAAAAKADAVGLVVGTGDYAAAKAKYDTPTGANDKAKAQSIQTVVDTLNKTIAINEAIQANNASALATALVNAEAEVTVGGDLFGNLSPAQQRLEVAQALIDATDAGDVYINVAAAEAVLQSEYTTYKTDLATLNNKDAANLDILKALQDIGFEDATLDQVDAYKEVISAEGFRAFTSLQAVKAAFEALTSAE